jgi:hypothetical protein
MLKEEELKLVAKNFVQYQKDYEYAVTAQQTAAATWDEVIRLLKNYDPEDADRERVIEECRRTGKSSNALIKSVHKAFDMLGIVDKPKSSVPSRRTRIIKVAVEQALGKQSGPKIRNKRLDTALEIEQQLEKGREGRALRILRAKLWENFDKAGRLIRDNYDIMTIEEAATYFSEDYVAAWHSTHDEQIARESAPKPTAKKANGGE